MYGSNTTPTGLDVNSPTETFLDQMLSFTEAQDQRYESPDRKHTTWRSGRQALSVTHSTGAGVDKVSSSSAEGRYIKLLSEEPRIWRACTPRTKATASSKLDLPEHTHLRGT